MVMGVAGSGKTTVARLAADQLGWAFLDADDYHTDASRAKMRAGVPLTDADRTPWLIAVRDQMEAYADAGQPVVVACSALRRSYRETLAATSVRTRFVWLDVPEDELRRRLTTRRGHFAGSQLLSSQLATLEPPSSEEAMRVPGDGALSEIVQQIIAAVD